VGGPGKPYFFILLFKFLEMGKFFFFFSWEQRVAVRKQKECDFSFISENLVRKYSDYGLNPDLTPPERMVVDCSGRTGEEGN
jgi:hypothetical protein